MEFAATSSVPVAGASSEAAHRPDRISGQVQQPSQGIPASVHKQASPMSRPIDRLTGSDLLTPCDHREGRPTVGIADPEAALKTLREFRDLLVTDERALRAGGRRQQRRHALSFSP